MNDKTILLVEDNKKDELLTIRALKKNKIVNRIEIARDGKQALNYLFSGENDLPAIIILDLKLSKLDGHEVLSQIRADVDEFTFGGKRIGIVLDAHQ